jgi:hypothetical protein
MIQSVDSPTANPEVARLGRLAELEPEALQLLQAGQGPRDFVDALMQAERPGDAVRFLAHLLPKREAIYWAWSIARQALDPAPSPETAAAMEATGRWIAEPTEANRRPMLDLAEAVGLGTPAGCAALAVFLSGGSVAPPDLPVVEPDPYAAAKAIAGAVVMAAVTKEPETAPEKFQAFVAQGVDIGRRVGLWPPDPPAT